ncbi:unnamed protein product [Phaeothamnion confervicola]
MRGSWPTRHTTDTQRGLGMAASMGSIGGSDDAGTSRVAAAEHQRRAASLEAEVRWLKAAVSRMDGVDAAATATFASLEAILDTVGCSRFYHVIDGDDDAVAGKNGAVGGRSGAISGRSGVGGGRSDVVLGRSGDGAWLRASRGPLRDSSVSDDDTGAGGARSATSLHEAAGDLPAMTAPAELSRRGGRLLRKAADVVAVLRLRDGDLERIYAKKVAAGKPPPAPAAAAKIAAASQRYEWRTEEGQPRYGGDGSCGGRVLEKPWASQEHPSAQRARADRAASSHRVRRKSPHRPAVDSAHGQRWYIADAHADGGGGGSGGSDGGGSGNDDSDGDEYGETRPLPRKPPVVAAGRGGLDQLRGEIERLRRRNDGIRRQLRLGGGNRGDGVVLSAFGGGPAR